MESEDAKKLILESIRESKPQAEELPTIPQFEYNLGNLIFSFGEVASSNGSRVLHLDQKEQLAQVISTHFPDRGQIISLVEYVSSNFDFNEYDQPRSFAGVDIAVLPAQLGVAENGAVWLSTDQIQPRILPFICQHLVVVLDKDNIRSNMHEAYQEIDLNRLGFGVFVAGPSKTADIEQSLVIGAQGARSHTICIV